MSFCNSIAVSNDMEFTGWVAVRLEIYEYLSKHKDVDINFYLFVQNFIDVGKNIKLPDESEECPELWESLLETIFSQLNELVVYIKKNI